MGQEDPIILLKDDFIEFRKWVDLKEEIITWEGRYEKEFTEFWGLFFRSGITLKQLYETFEFAESFIKSGPLVSWFHWLHAKMVCYIFIKKGLSIEEISEQFVLPEAGVALTLRDFFVERYPHLEERISQIFHICDPLSENIHLVYEHFAHELGIITESKGALSSDVLNTLEVTLYPEWRRLLTVMKRDYLKKGQRARHLESKNFWRKQFAFVREVVIILLVGGVLMTMLKFGNKWYEEYLVNRISLFEPNFFKLDENLSFKRERPQLNREVRLSMREMEELEKAEKENAFEDNFEERFEPESEVILTSVEALPRDFSTTEYEQSDYEEERKGGYRDSRYGNSETYRLIMNSVDPIDLKDRVNTLLKKYSVSQVDNVKPGTLIPGGIYYNLYVPNKHLREFVAQISDLEPVSIYKSTSLVRVPAGKKRVFIWIKSI